MRYGMFALALAFTVVGAGEARAHCDTMDGPVVKSAQHALATDSVEHVLMWVSQHDEAEVRQAFARTRSVRALNAGARDLADRWFFETVVRLHRAGEGEPYTGLKPAGTDLGPVVPAADRALQAGSLAELEEVLVHAVRNGLHERFDRARAARAFTPGDVAAGRAFVAAYVPFMHYAERVHAAAGESAPHAH